ncbi:hypothetical protein B0H10DRAFT_524994 [Mycena sp. CBHHK59/15]|nr:hypothetical protein B0H10DRAFT_524994 [Mycena sp. CBHHK59/15]
MGSSVGASASGAEDEAPGWEGAWTSRRPQFWTFKPWEQPPSPTSGRTAYIFPPPPLLFSLISLYFEHTNAYLPLLHRPSFERDVSEGRHERRGEEGFGGPSCWYAPSAAGGATTRAWWARDWGRLQARITPLRGRTTSLLVGIAPLRGL